MADLDFTGFGSTPAQLKGPSSRVIRPKGPFSSSSPQPAATSAFRCL